MSGTLLTVEQAAHRLSLHPKTVLRFIREKRLRATRIGKAYRILTSDLESFAGAESGHAGLEARATTVTEIAPISEASAITLANRLLSLLHGRSRGRAAHLTTAYDAMATQLKVVFIANAADSSAFLSALNVMVQDL
jgi:excisionase family DNA binding protein